MARTEAVEKRSNKAKHFRNDDGTFTAEISSASIHYRNTPDGPWLDKNIGFKPGGISDESDVVVRHLRSGPTDFIEFTEKLTGKGIRYELTGGNVTVPSSGNVLRFAGGYTYTLTGGGGKLEGPQQAVRLGQRNLDFRYILLGEAQALSIGPDGTAANDVFRISPPVALGADGRQYSIGTLQLPVAGTLRFALDDSALPDAALPYKLDPTTSFNIAATADDGMVEGWANFATWPPPFNAVYTSHTEDWIERDINTSSNRNLTNGMLRFDTSSIPDAATLISATLRQYSTNSGNGLGYNYYVGYYPWTPPMGSSDYATTASNNAHVGTGISSIPFGSNDFALQNLSNINKSGYTGFRSFVADGSLGGTPGGISVTYVQFYTSDGSIAPVLIVDYTVPDATSPATYPVSDDGHVLQSSGAYPPVSAVGRDMTAANFTVRRSVGFTVVVGLLSFDTSSLPDLAVITAATLQLVPIAGEFTFDDARNLVAEYYAWDGTDSDYTATAANSAHAGTAVSTLTTDAVNSFVLQNLSSISKTGLTKLRLHISGGQPTGQNNVDIATIEHATFQEPRLVVTFSTGTPQPLVPDGASIQMTNLSGTFADIDDDPASPGTDWLVFTG